MWEWLTGWPHKITDVVGVAREGALVQLTAVPGMDEKLDGAAQGGDGAREAAGAATQTSQIVAWFRVDSVARPTLAHMPVPGEAQG